MPRVEDSRNPSFSAPVDGSQPAAVQRERVLADSSGVAAAERVELLERHSVELDWSDPESALETLAVLNDPEAIADLREAEHDIAAGNLLPLDRYAPPG